MSDITNVRNMTAEERKQAARQLYRESAAAGYPLTGKELGEHFERGERWGQDRVREAKTEARESSPARLPGEVELNGLPPLATPPSLPSEPQPSPVAPIAETAEPQYEPQSAIAETAEPQYEPQSANAETAEPQYEPQSANAETAMMIMEPQQPHNPQRRGASAVSWLAFGIGILVSILANIGHIWFVSQPEAEAMVSAMIFAGFWPIGLAIAVEVLSRVTWPKGLKWFGIAGTVFVGGVALVVSYRHMNGLLLHFGESELSAALGPLGVDGLLIVGGFAILAIGETKRRNRS